LWKVQLLQRGYQHLVIRTIRLTSADVHEADPLRTVDDKRGRPSDVERREPKPMMDAVALNYGAIGIDEDPQGETVSARILAYLLGALADDDQYLSPETMIYR
jgi:hypothetical protein